MENLNIRFTASEASKVKGDRWEVIFIEEGDFADGKHHVTKAALEKAHSNKMLDGVYVQELQFRDGTTRHLPEDLENAAPSGVFGNVIGVISDTFLQTLNDGRTALAGFVDAIDDQWKQRMNILAAKGHRLPGVSFNALIPFNALKERLNEQGRTIKDILDWTSFDTVEVVSYPNAGGAIVRAVAGGDLDPSAAEPPQSEPITITDRTFYMKTELLRYFSLRGIPANDEDPLNELIQAAVKSEEFKALRPAEQQLVTSLTDIEEPVGTRIVASLIELANEAAPVASEEPADVTPEPESPPQAAVPVQAGLPDMSQFDNMLEERMKTFTLKLEEEFSARQRLLEEENRLQAGRNLINASTLPDQMKQLAISQLEASRGDGATILKSFEDAVAPLAEEGRVRASVSPYSIHYGANDKDKQKIGLLKLVGAKPKESEIADWKNVPAYRSIGHAFTNVTGINAEYMTLEEFNNPRRIKADINMFEVADFPNVLGDTLNRAVVDQFNEQPHTWEDFTVQRKGVRDFKNLKINRVGGFTVPLDTYSDTGTGVSTRYEGGITLVAPPSEQQGTYAPAIYADQFALTYQTLRNDDIGMVHTWLRRFAEACDETALYQTMMAFINFSSTINGGTISLDSKALYHADHSNIRTDALTYESLRAACAMIRAQVDGLGSSKPLNQQPYMLVIPESLRDTGEVLVGTPDRPTSNDNDINTIRYLKLVIMHDFWLGSDANNWYVTADPKKEKSAFLEIAFLDDKTVPTILTANDATSGRMFTHLRTEFSGVYIFGVGHRGYEGVVGSFPT